MWAWRAGRGCEGGNWDARGVSCALRWDEEGVIELELVGCVGPVVWVIGEGGTGWRGGPDGRCGGGVEVMVGGSGDTGEPKIVRAVREIWRW